MANVLTRRLSGRKPGSDLSGRTVGSNGGFIWMGGAAHADRSARPSLLHPPHPYSQPRLPRHVLRTGSGTTCRIPFLCSPILTPRPYLYFPCVRLHRTMPCHGTYRVCVLECPPLGRPSLIKLVLVKTRSLPSHSLFAALIRQPFSAAAPGDGPARDPHGP